VEKNLSLNYDEAAALLEMSLFGCLDKQGPEVESALRKLGDLCRELSAEDREIDRMPVSQEFKSTCAL